MRKAICMVLVACAGAGDPVTRSGRSPIEGVASATDIPSTGKVPEGCTRIEGADIGEAGLVVPLHGGDVTFTTWRQKDGEPGEYVGFELSSALSLGYAVKTGGKMWFGTSGTWLHPGGTGGPNAQGISNVTVCPLNPGGGGAGGGAGGSGGGAAGGNGGGGGLDEGSPCTSNAQCLSGRCTEGICIPAID